MDLTVYIDVFFFVNVCMDFIILFIVKKIGTVKSTYFRLSLGSAVGGILGCLAFIITGVPVFLKIVTDYMITGMVMVLIAFPFEGIKKLIIQMIEMYLAAFCLDGFINFIINHNVSYYVVGKTTVYQIIGTTELSFLLVAGGVFVIIFSIYGTVHYAIVKNDQLFLDVEVGYRSEVVRGIGLVDSGNLLKDPVTRQSVMVTEYEFVKKLFTIQEKKQLELFMKQQYGKEKEIENEPFLVRMIPYHSMGQENGLLTAIKVDYIKIKKNGLAIIRKKILLGLYQGKLSSKGNYQMILYKDCV